MVKKISQQGEQLLTRSERIKQRYAEQRALQSNARASPVNQQKAQVDLKISQEQKQLQLLENERQKLTERAGTLTERERLNREYQARIESVKARISALQDINREINKGFYFEPQYVEDYVSAYENASAQARQKSIRASAQRIKAKAEQKIAEQQQEELSKSKIKDIQIVEESKDGKITGKKYYAVSEENKYYEIQKPVDYLKQLSDSKTDYDKQINQAIAENKKTLSEKPYELKEYLSVVREPRRETKSIEPKIEFVLKSDIPSLTKFTIGGIAEGIKKITSIIPSEPLVLNLPRTYYGVPFGVPTISTQTFNPKGILLSDIKEGTGVYFDTKISDLIESDIESKGIKKELEPIYQERFQTSFERQYFEPIIKGEISFEEAQSRFSESDVAKIIGESYSKEVNIKRAEGGFKGVFNPTTMKVATLGFIKGATDFAIPTTTTEFAVKGAVVGGGIYALKNIPYLAGTLETGFVVKGTADFINPLKLPEERFGGLVKGAIGGALLTSRIVKWTRTPTIKTIKITPEARLKELDKIAKTSPIKNPKGWEREISKDIYGKTTQADYYKFSKLDEQIISGQRTIVSTKLRDTLGFKPIYEGVPYVDKTGYASALKVLTKRTSLTTAQAKEYLKYNKPKTIMYETKGVTSIIQGDKLTEPQLFTKGYRITTPEVREINKLLGIKTGGGIATKDYFTARGKPILTKGDTTFYESIIKSQKTFLTEEGFPYSKLSKAGKTTTTFKQITGVNLKDSWSFNNNEITAELLKERSIVSQLIPKSKDLYLSRGNVLAFSKNQPQSIYKDMQEITGLNAKEVPIQKVNEIKNILNYNNKDTQKLIQSLESVYGKQKGISASASITSTPASASSTQKLINQATSLKVVQSPPILKLESKINSLTGITKATGSVFGTASLIAVSSAMESNLKKQNKFADKLTEINKLDYKLDSKLKQTPRIKQAQRTASSLKQLFIEPQIVSQLLRTPTSPPTKTPTARIIPFDFGGKDFLKNLLKTRRKRKSKKDFSYAPTFTEKAFDIKPIEISIKQAEKLLTKQFTGFENFPVVKLKWT